MDNEEKAVEAMTEKAIEEAMKKRFTCQYNDGVECGSHIYCEKCGWNPAVSARRKEIIKERKRVFQYDL